MYLKIFGTYFVSAIDKSLNSISFELFGEKTKKKKLIPKAENEDYQKTDVTNSLFCLLTKTSRKDSKFVLSVSMVKFMLSCCRLIYKFQNLGA